MDMANAFKTYKAPNIEPVENGLGTSDKGNASSSSEPRKKTMTSVYLKHFKTDPDGKSRSCKFVAKVILLLEPQRCLFSEFCTIEANLGRHPTNQHRSNQTATASAPQPTIVPKKMAHLDYSHLNWCLIRWLIQASIPPSTLDEKWLVN